jgi:hypothetical protein
MIIDIEERGYCVFFLILKSISRKNKIKFISAPLGQHLTKGYEINKRIKIGGENCTFNIREAKSAQLKN